MAVSTAALCQLPLQGLHSWSTLKAGSGGGTVELLAFVNKVNWALIIELPHPLALFPFCSIPSPPPLASVLHVFTSSVLHVLLAASRMRGPVYLLSELSANLFPSHRGVWRKLLYHGRRWYQGAFWKDPFIRQWIKGQVEVYYITCRCAEENYSRGVISYTLTETQATTHTQ